MVEEVQPDRTLAQLVERIPDKDEVTGPSPVRPTMSTAAKTALLTFARSVSGERLYGDFDYYRAKTVERNNVINQLCDYIASLDGEWEKSLAAKDQEIAALKAQQLKLVDKIFGVVPEPAVPAPTVQTVQQGIGANRT